MKLADDSSRRRFRLAVVSTHPIQYHTPWYQAMHRHPRLELTVFYGYRATPRDQAGAGFGVEFDWDIPLLDGHPHVFLENVASRPGFEFRGIDIPGVDGALRQGAFDAVLVQGWHYKGAWQALKAARAAGSWTLVRSDSQLRGQRTLLKRFLKWLPYRLFIPRLDACIAVGSRSRDYFLHYGACREKVFVVPHTIGEHWFEDLPSPDQRTRLRQQWEISPETLVFVFVGKLEPKKRPLDVLQAAARLPRDQVAVVVIGDGELRAECQTFVRECQLQTRFLGFVNQGRMPEAYALGDALVLPSDGGETWGLVVNEAMARGLPCLASEEVGSVPDLILPGETGEVFRFAELGSLEEKMRDCLGNRGKWLEMGRNARRRAEAYRPEAAAEAMLRALDTLDGRQRGRKS